jgi:hypothetical protein
MVPAMSDSPPVPASFGTVACGLCQVYEARWVHALAAPRAEFGVHGKGHIWGSPLAVCDSCDRLLGCGDAGGLVNADPRSAELPGTELEEQVRNGVHALLAADLGGHDIDEDRPPGYRELVEQGFTPLETITGALHLARAWPEDHCRTLPATDPASAGYLPDGKHWFIRSPWPSIPLEPLFHLVIRTVDSTLDRQPGHGYDEHLVNAAVRELLRGSEHDVAARLNV